MIRVTATSEPPPSFAVPRACESDGAALDFSLQGLIAVRLLDPSPRDTAAMTERFGPPVAGSPREPDLTIRFADHLLLPPDACHLGNEAAFTADCFYLRRQRTSDRARAMVALDQVGRGGELLVERGADPPLLTELLNLCVLARGGLALHASAFEFEGRGCVVSGWPHGGKTSALIGMLEAGARYVADDWTFLHPDAETLSGLPAPVEVRERYLRDAPEMLARVPGHERRRLALLGVVESTARAAVHLTGAVPPLRRLAARGAHASAERRKVRMPPAQLFGAAGCATTTTLDTFILCLAYGRAAVDVQELSPAEAAPRILASLEYERNKLQSYYSQFRCAFPDRFNPVLERAPALEEQRLRRALGRKAIYLVRHPAMAAPSTLAKALLPLLRQQGYRDVEPPAPAREFTASRSEHSE